MERTRRSVLQAGAGALALGTLAGCLSDPVSGEADGGYASFFALWDMASEIGGDELEFENAVPTGDMGHGYEPSSDLQRDIADSDVFVYFETDEFGWVEEYVVDFERDYDHLTLIDAMDGLEDQFLEMDSDTAADQEPDNFDDDPESVSVVGFELFERRSGEELAWWHNDHWHGGLPDVAVGETLEVEAVVEDSEGRILPIGSNELFQLEATTADDSEGETVEIDSQGDHVIFSGLEEDMSRVVFELVADDEVVFDTSNDNARLEVVDEVEDSDVPEMYDPHVWVDPVLVRDIVGTIRDGLIEADPDNEDVYEENAAAYIDRIDDVHEQLQGLFEDADRDIAVLAGHDAFQYLEARYDIELHTPVGISPDDNVSPNDISDTIEIIEENDIDTILYDPFDDMSNVIDEALAETDAEDTARLSPLEGTTEEWEDDGYGWVEQMEEVNIPALQAAFGAD
ncbi:metal ABC transporter solute-binding protein, Zn/Mn family [Natronorubrum daqingense]|uniref:Zinc ABC transporter substrate-binding protein n=1 Tax=Natronorubrum daqingense TaxID=588898 RepID=A0A1N6XQY4_9EURY|nr:zinc ABC transporter substrate-binding protein [Natronorubrum daqingense]APX95887.1 zinc ABC transporter substrate-binding protein [Natronorubrum daqingense]SIR04629.1 zinc transport system substrate-binding protein [Natronorubrum daqingense]